MSELGDLIIEQGPYRSGDFNPLRDLTSDGINALRDELIAARKLRQVTAALVDTDPCEHFDHHGQCQTHLAGTVDGRCAQAVAKDLLSKGGAA